MTMIHHQFVPSRKDPCHFMTEGPGLIPAIRSPAEAVLASAAANTRTVTPRV